MINNLWMQYLGDLGYTGTINQRIYSWLDDNTTGEAETINELWTKFLNQKGYEGQINTMQMQWLGDEGYTGTLNQRFIQFLQFTNLYPDIPNNIARDITFYSNFDKQIYTEPSDTFSDLYNFNRNSDAWGLGQDGKYHKYLPDEPRFVYNPDGTFAGLLREAQQTNNFTHSYDLVSGAASGNLNWVKRATLSYTNSGGMPGAGYSTITNTADDAKHVIGGVSGVAPPSGTMSCSFIFDPKGERFVQVGKLGSAVYDLSVVYDSNAKSLSSVGSAVSQEEVRLLANGLVEVRFACVDYSVRYNWVLGLQILDSNGNHSYPGNGESIDVYHMQASLGSEVPISPIVTNGSAITRAEDQIVVPNATSFIDNTQGTIFVESTTPGGTISAAAALFSRDPWGMGIYLSLADSVSARMRTNGAGNVTLHSGITGHTKACLTYGNGMMAFFVNGSKIGEQAADHLYDGPDTNFYLGHNGSRIRFNDAWCSNEPISDADAIELTTL